MQEGIEIKLNGESTRTKSPTLSALLFELGLAEKKIAIELNKDIIPRNAYENTKLTFGDQIEIIHFVGGG